MHEGGTRTPFISYWPGQVATGESVEIVCTIDLPHSLATLAGVPLPPDACVDSANVLAALLGRPGAVGRDHLVQQNNNGNVLGLRVREASHDWKLIWSPNKQVYNQVVEETLRGRPVPEFQLFDLIDDAGESTDLAGRYPEVVRRLREKLDRIRIDGGSRF